MFLKQKRSLERHETNQERKRNEKKIKEEKGREKKSQTNFDTEMARQTDTHKRGGGGGGRDDRETLKHSSHQPVPPVQCERKRSQQERRQFW